MSIAVAYPENAELTKVAQTYIGRLTQDRLGFKIMPMVTQHADELLWDQQDNFVGLQQIRGINGAPPRVARIGAKRWRMAPGYYGEFLFVDEAEITRRRQFGDPLAPVSLDDIILELQNQLLLRELDLMETIIWTLLSTGTFSIANGAGKILNTDTFNIQTYTSTVPWSTPGTATPLADFRTIMRLGPAVGTDFGASAKVIMNQLTFNQLLSNTNNADIYGRRTAGLGTFNNLKEVNTLFLGDNLPTIEVYDLGYYTDSGTFTRFIPDGTAIVIGRRLSGDVIGNYRLTMNANNAGAAPGSYSKVIDTLDRTVPRQVEIHRGHNGGPVLFFPGSIVSMNVG